MEPIFSEGQEVEVIRNGDSHFGQRGEVSSVDTSGGEAEYEVTFGEDDIYYYTEDDIVSI